MSQDSRQIISEIDHQVEWLAATFRVAKWSSFSKNFSAAKVRMDGGIRFVRPARLTSGRNGPRMCWHSLFKTMPIANDFRIPSCLSGFSGLELPYDLLFRLCGVQHPIEYEGGLILKGYYTILIPVCVSEEAIQWHLLDSKPAYIDIKVLGSDIRNVPDPGFVLDKAYLDSRRSFLGFCPTIVNHLGTEYISATRLLSSDSPCEGSRLKLSSFVGTMGTSGLGIFGAAVGTNIAWTSALAGIERIKDISTDDRVFDAMENPIILYNTVDEVAWLTSEICFMVQLLRNFYSQVRRARQPRQVAAVSEVPVMQASNDGARTAYQHVSENWGFVLETDPNGEEITYGRRFEQLFAVLEQRKNSIQARLIESSRPRVLSKLSSSDSLPAWDMEEMLHFSSIPTRRRLTFKGQSWPVGFAKNCNILCVCYKGLGDPFIPTPAWTQCLCNPCKKAPIGKDCLIAEARLLQRGLNDGLCWDANRKPPFEPCKTGCSGLRDRIQTIERVGKGKRTLSSELEGAVLFGNPKHFEKHQCDIASLPQNGKYQHRTDASSSQELPVRSL